MVVKVVAIINKCKYMIVMLSHNLLDRCDGVEAPAGRPICYGSAGGGTPQSFTRRRRPLRRHALRLVLLVSSILVLEGHSLLLPAVDEVVNSD